MRRSRTHGKGPMEENTPNLASVTREDRDAQTGALGAADWAAVNELALWLHGQGDLMSLRDGIVERVGELVPHSATMFDLCRMRDGRMEFFSPASRGIQQEWLEEYYRTYASQDYTTWSFSTESAITYRDFDLISPALRDASPIYRGWMEPQGLYFGMGCTIVANKTMYGTLTLFRGRDEGNFTDAEVASLRELMRHLCVHFGTTWPRGLGGSGSAGGIVDGAGMTSREEEVCALLAAGRTNRQIAQELYISESTAKKHVNAIYRKLGVRNRVELARVLLEDRGGAASGEG